MAGSTDTSGGNYEGGSAHASKRGNARVCGGGWWVVAAGGAHTEKGQRVKGLHHAIPHQDLAQMVRFSLFLHDGMCAPREQRGGCGSETACGSATGTCAGGGAACGSGAQARAVCSHCWSTRHTTHLLRRAKGQRIVLVLLRRVAIGPNLPARPDRTPPPPGVTRVWHRRRGGGRRRAGAHGAVAAAAHTLLAYSGTLSPRWYVLPFASTTCRDSHHRPAGAPHRACRRERGGERERVRRCAARAGVPARGRAPAGQRPPARRQGSFASPARRAKKKENGICSWIVRSWTR